MVGVAVSSNLCAAVLTGKIFNGPLKSHCIESDADVLFVSPEGVVQERLNEIELGASVGTTYRRVRALPDPNSVPPTRTLHDKGSIFTDVHDTTTDEPRRTFCGCTIIAEAVGPVETTAGESGTLPGILGVTGG